MPSPRLLATALSATLLAACTTVAPAAPARSMQELLDASQPSDWRALDPDDTVYLELASGRVVIELAPAFAPAHVANIRALAQGHYWDGLSIYRSHDNFVVQFGDPTEDEAARKSIGDAQADLPAEFDRPTAGLPCSPLRTGWPAPAPATCSPAPSPPSAPPGATRSRRPAPASGSIPVRRNWPARR